jgi:uncharacterized protein (TIGR03435 family)
MRLFVAVLFLVLIAPVAAQQKFEVVSVRPNRDTTVLGLITTQPGGRFIVQNFELREVISAAYGLRDYQLVDVPEWARSERYDIMALTGRDDYMSIVQMRPLIQTLLADRFQLQIAREQRVMQTYALVRVRPDALGPAIRSVITDCTPPDRRDPALGKFPCGFRRSSGSAIGTAVMMPDLVALLDARLGTLVTDETGLRGQFDLTLKWTPDGAAGAGDGVSLFTAVQEQLGLKLDPRRTAVDVVAIKRLERPTGN